MARRTVVYNNPDFDDPQKTHASPLPSRELSPTLSTRPKRLGRVNDFHALNQRAREEGRKILWTRGNSWPAI